MPDRLTQALSDVTRAKNGTPATHPLDRREANALRELRKQYPDSSRVFVTERGSPLSQSVVRHIVKRAGKWAKIAFPVHPHQLRHACGYHLANRPPTRGRFRRTSDIATSNTPPGIQRWRRTALTGCSTRRPGLLLPGPAVGHYGPPPT